MLKAVNLNVIIIIVLLILVIIILSSIKSCDNVKKNSTVRFVDQKYTYVSEPFTSENEEEPETNTPSPTSVYDLLADKEIYRQGKLVAEQAKRNSEIQTLTDDISSLENKINVMKQYVE